MSVRWQSDGDRWVRGDGGVVYVQLYEGVTWWAVWVVDPEAEEPVSVHHDSAAAAIRWADRWLAWQDRVETCGMPDCAGILCAECPTGTWSRAGEPAALVDRANRGVFAQVEDHDDPAESYEIAVCTGCRSRRGGKGRHLRPAHRRHAVTAKHIDFTDLCARNVMQTTPTGGRVLSIREEEIEPGIVARQVIYARALPKPVRRALDEAAARIECLEQALQRAVEELRDAEDRLLALDDRQDASGVVLTDRPDGGDGGEVADNDCDDTDTTDVSPPGPATTATATTKPGYAAGARAVLRQMEEYLVTPRPPTQVVARMVELGWQAPPAQKDERKTTLTALRKVYGDRLVTTGATTNRLWSVRPSGKVKRSKTPAPAAPPPRPLGLTDALRQLAKDHQGLGWLQPAALVDLLAEYSWPPPGVKNPRQAMRSALVRLVEQGEWSARPGPSGVRGDVYRPGGGRQR